MRWLLTHYHPQFVRSVVYMLQATEYNLNDFFSWYLRVEDFRTVEKRKHLSVTNKTLALLIFCWSIIGLFVVFTLAGLGNSALPIISAILAFIMLPFTLLALLSVFIILLKYFVQLPYEVFVARKIEEILSKHPATKIGIAGSYGKTSMREILKTVLSEGKKVAAPPGSYNTLLGIYSFVKALDGDEEVLIFELGEYYPGDVKKLCEVIHPDIGIITGVNEAHLEKFKDIRRTVSTIFELAEYMKNKPVYVNGENKLALREDPKNPLLYSRKGVAELSVTNQSTDLEGTKFTVTEGDHVTEYSTKLLGLHQIGPLTTAIKIAKDFGLGQEQITVGVKNTKAFDHRLQPSDREGVLYLDDSYNGNPDGVRAVIDFLSHLNNRNRFYVTPGLVEMGDKMREVHISIGKQLAEAGIENIVLVKNSVTPFIEEGLKSANFTGKIHWYDDALKALLALPHITVGGDIVLLQNDWPDQYA